MNLKTNTLMPKGHYHLQTLYACMAASDGYSLSKPIAYFESWDTAKQYSMGRDRYGGDCEVARVTLLALDTNDGTVYTRLDNIEWVHIESDKDALVAAAYAKLSLEEREALGLPPTAKEVI